MATPAPYLTAAEVRARQPDLVNDHAWPDGLLDELVRSFEDKLEAAVGVAFRPRTRVLSMQCVGGIAVLPDLLVDPFTVEVLEHPEDASGTPVPAMAVSGRSGVVRSHLLRGYVHVRYEHGHVEPPAAVLQACALYVWHEAKSQRSPATNNSYLRFDGESGAMERISTADPDSGRITGWLDVDRLLSGYRPAPLGFA